jgi:probable addiction module antidote protein
MAMPVEFEPFDISEHLDSEEMIAGYLNAAAADEDPNVLLGALAHAAKARGMIQVARDAGLNRESLYKALKPGAHPRFETVQAVLRALGVKLTVSARTTAGEERKKTADLNAETRLTTGLAETMEGVVETMEALVELEKKPNRGRAPKVSADEPEPRRKRSRAGGAAHHT